MKDMHEGACMTEDSRNSDDSEAKPIPAKGKGSFWISRQAISVLLAEKATATEICAFLVLARFTDESGCFCSAGNQAVFRAVGVGHAIAGAALKRLQGYRFGANPKISQSIVCPADDWATATGKQLPHGPIALAKIRWVLNNFDGKPEDRVWFGNELVDGFGKFKQPLKRLKRCGDVATRLLMICYREHDLDQFGGVRPTGAFYWKYEMEKIFSSFPHGKYDLWHGNDAGTWVFNCGSLPALGITKFSAKEEEKAEQIAPFWRAVEALDSAGFIYQVVTVMDRNGEDVEAQVIYELDTKSRHGYKPQGERGLGGETAKLSGNLGRSVADSAGRLYGKYAAIVPAGVPAFIVGICRIRFRVANPKNHGIKGAWARIYGGQNEAKEWIDDANEKYGFAKTSTDEHEVANEKPIPF